MQNPLAIIDFGNWKYADEDRVAREFGHFSDIFKTLPAEDQSALLRIFREILVKWLAGRWGVDKGWIAELISMAAKEHKRGPAPRNGKRNGRTRRRKSAK